MPLMMKIYRLPGNKLRRKPTQLYDMWGDTHEKDGQQIQFNNLDLHKFSE